MSSEAQLTELLGRMRGFAVDHEPHGWLAIQMRDITALCDAIVALNTRNRGAEADLGNLLDARDATADYMARIPDGCAADPDFLGRLVRKETKAEEAARLLRIPPTQNAG